MQGEGMKTWDDIPQGEDRIQVYPTLAQAREQFGENYDGLVFRLTRAQVEALLHGQVVAFDIRDREYAGFLIVEEPQT
jgi:hypothetical protein